MEPQEPPYPIDYVHNVQRFSKESTSEQRTFVFAHLVGPLKGAFQLDDVAAGTMACQLWSGTSLNPMRLATAMATAVGFLIDTHRLDHTHQKEASQKISEIMRVYIPAYMEQFGEVPAPLAH